MAEVEFDVCAWQNTLRDRLAFNPGFPPALNEEWLVRQFAEGAKLLATHREGDIETVVLQRPDGIPYEMCRQIPPSATGDDE